MVNRANHIYSRTPGAYCGIGIFLIYDRIDSGLSLLKMVFSYYNKLSAAQKRTYRKSDEIHMVPLADGRAFQPLIERLDSALEQEDRAQTEEICRTLVLDLASSLGVPPLRLKVLPARPTGGWGELHGLYELAQGRASAVITLWMRTARHKRVVAFRTFLRTFLHEFCHHLDYHRYGLDDSFHTEGFYKRESSLFHQLVPEPAQPHKRA
jgi:hypothetical protein